MLQVVFHAGIETDAGNFDIDDVCDEECRKMILRHPHIFGDHEKLDTPESTFAVWDAVKAQEKHQRTYTDTMNDVAKTLPALMYANKVQGRAKKSGFDWPSVEGAMDKVREETAEVQACLDAVGGSGRSAAACDTKIYGPVRAGGAGRRRPAEDHVHRRDDCPVGTGQNTNDVNGYPFS